GETEHRAPHKEPCASAASARPPAVASASSKSLNRISAIIVARIIPQWVATNRPLQCGMTRSILGPYERSQPEISRRTRTEALGKASGRSHRHGESCQGREPRAAAAARHSHLRTRNSAAEERAGACAGRGHDRPTEVDGAGMSDNQARVSVRILEKEYHISCP